MSILDDIKSLDPNDPGRWPLPVRIGAVALCFVVLAAFLFYFLVWTDQKPILDRVVAEEQTLRETFKKKHSKAVNLEVYQQQTSPIIDYYKQHGADVSFIDGDRDIEQVQRDILEIVDR